MDFLTTKQLFHGPMCLRKARVRRKAGGTLAAASDSNVMDDRSNYARPLLGKFIRRCVLAFNPMPFGGICHLLTNIETYCKESLSGYPPYELSNLDAAANDLDSSPGFENMEMENFIYEKVSEDFKESQMGLRRVPFHGHAPRALSVLVEGTDISWRPRMEDSEAPAEVDYSAVSSSDMSGGIGSFSSMFMQTNWQVRGYLAEQANAIGKNSSAFPRHAFESILKKASEIGTRIGSS